MANGPLIVETPEGLYCPAGDFHVDAWGAVARDIVTHAHSDHARRGSQRYLTSREGLELLRYRMGPEATIDAIEFGIALDINGVRVSLHPAGHVRGSAQVRIEHGGEVWVISGDYKRQKDLTCSGFEVVPCNTFVTECTFGLPIFHWEDPGVVAAEINAWWRHNQEKGRTSILLAYSLGKAQRVLSGLDAGIGPILLHGAVHALTEIYRAGGAPMPATLHASAENAKQHRRSALVIAPPSAMTSPWARKFAPFSLGIASGWMQVRGIRRRQGADRGFVLSDHVDFGALLQTIGETGAQRVIATHGYTEALVGLMRQAGVEAAAFATRFSGEEEEADMPADPATGPESAKEGGDTPSEGDVA
jgi:putative mRNA 3-end processing factor